MVRLVDDLLDVSRITRDKIQLRNQRLTLTAIIQSALETSGPVIQAAGHELTIDLPSEPIFVDADFTRLSQVFANLLRNAAKYTEDGGRIWLNAIAEASEVVITVRDTGNGIPAELLPCVFQMCTQINAHLDRSQGGLGIGLALSKRLVELHHGTIDAKSEGVGKGNTFTVRLPISKSAGGSGLVLAHDEVARPKTTHRVLVVDDNADASSSLASMLRMMGHEVRLAYDGIEAIEIGEAFQPG